MTLGGPCCNPVDELLSDVHGDLREELSIEVHGDPGVDVDVSTAAKQKGLFESCHRQRYGLHAVIVYHSKRKNFDENTCVFFTTVKLL